MSSFPDATDQILGIVTGESRVTKLFLTPVYAVTNGNDVDVCIVITSGVVTSLEHGQWAW